jgi:hypothetical protein
LYPRRPDAVEVALEREDTMLVRTGETIDILLDVTTGPRDGAPPHRRPHERAMRLSFGVALAVPLPRLPPAPTLGARVSWDRVSLLHESITALDAAGIW